MSGNGNNASTPNSKGKKKSKNNNKVKESVKISTNSISINNKTGSRSPKTMTMGNSTILSHTETYGVNITGSANYETFATFAVQPGISTYSRGSPLGQWLPQIAANFDNYEILSLKLTYRSACSTLEPGLIIFAYEPNPEGTTPVSYQEIRNMHSVDGSVHANLSFDVSKLVKRPYLIRKRAVVNLPSYDAGKIYISTIGCTDDAKLGFVDVTYSVRLYNPQSQNSSTEIVPITFNPVAPVQLVRVTGVTGATINAASAANDVTSVLLAQTNTTIGANLFAAGNYASPALNLNFSGMKFVDSAANRYHWVCNYSGRYRVDYIYNCDFEDLKLFASAIMTRIGAGPWVIAQQQIVSVIDGSDPQFIDTVPVGHRGFTGVVTLDPNPATDLPLVGSHEISILQGHYLTVAIGVQEYNNVSTTTANVKFVAGRGNQCNIRFTYLGPIQTLG